MSSKCEQCGSTDPEDIGRGGYSECCNEPVVSTEPVDGVYREWLYDTLGELVAVWKRGEGNRATLARINRLGGQVARIEGKTLAEVLSA
jgi:hypothetical protein